MEEAERAKLQSLIEELESYRGRHTELITVYAPAGANINQVTTQLVSEQSTAQNIKSKTTRTNVIDALERILRHLKLYKKLPENGLAIFCGNVSKTEGQPDIKLWAIEPPQPLKVRFYRCDQTFVLVPLKEMLEAKEVYGLIVLDRKEATLGTLEGKSIRKLRHLTSGVPGKIKAGGQSAQRFERITEELAKEFYRRISENAKELFFGMPRFKGLIIGGPGPTKEEWLKEGQLITELRKKIITIKDVGYTDERGLHHLVEASRDELAEAEITKEKKILEKFFTTLGKEPEKVTYGVENVNKALEVGAVDTLIISTSFDKKIASEMEKKAKSIAAEVVYVSTETHEGIQFSNLKGIGALLRFAIT
ncbi:MAG: peptide chain release factor aRF-1 [Candidatus Pacearchaeota archaeon]|nr:peptide chain release factor aRF-1 [Candidatus Pacearchaeota archaeon]